MKFAFHPTCSTRRFAFALAVAVAPLVARAADREPKPAGPNAVAADLDGFRTRVAPFLSRHCRDCHGEKKPEADLSLTSIDADVPRGKDIEAWKTIAERLALGEMPPEGRPRPDAAEADAVLAWIKVELTKGGEDVSGIGRKLVLPGHGNRVDHAALFAGKITAPAASPARLWRFRPQIYESLVPRIGGKDTRVGQPFSAHSGRGFKDFADLFVVDEPTIGQLLRNAQQLVAVQLGQTRFAKPVKEFVPLLDESREPTREEIDRAVRRQFQLALLRDPTEDESRRFAELFAKNAADAGRAIGTKSTLAAVLLLPEATYRFELGTGTPDESGRILLSPRELAWAVSFALTDQAPDAALLGAAEKGRLATPADVRREVERILADRSVTKPRILRFLEEYFEYPAAVDVFKDVGRGQWKPEVLVNDARLLIADVLAEDRDVLRTLLTTNRYYVNARRDPKSGMLVEARPYKRQEPKIDKKTKQPIPEPPRDPLKKLAVHDHYDLPLDWEWTDRQPIEFPEDRRAGLLTHPAWLAAFATNNETHPIDRGKWIRERLLGGVIPDVPITVDAKLPDEPHHTVRERMRVTQETYCWNCHRRMNPLGLAFESYDFLGRFRTTETVLDLEATARNVDAKTGAPKGPVTKEVPLDASGLVEASGDAALDGPVANGVQMIRKLAESPRVRQVFVRHVFRYWMGRNETPADAPVLLAADESYVKSGGSLNALIASLLSSDAFVYRRP